MHKTKNTLPKTVRAQSIKLLNELLAQAIDLHAKTKQAHWNVKGPNFIALHELFDKVADEVEGFSDLIAERATTLGGVAEGTLQVAVKRSPLKPYPLDLSDGRDHVERLSSVMADFGTAARGAIDTATRFGDADTADLFTEVSREIDKQLWFVEAHLQAKR